MALKKIADYNDLPSLRFEDEDGAIRPGESIQGYIKGVEHNVVTKYKPEGVTVYTIQTAEGDFKIWPPSMLARLLQRVKVGSLTEITFVGEEQSKKNKRNTVKVFEVASDDEDCLDPSEIMISKSSFKEAEEDVDMAGADEVEDDAPAEEEEEQKPRASSKPSSLAKTGAAPKNAAAASSSKDKLNSLLSKSKARATA